MIKPLARLGLSITLTALAACSSIKTTELAPSAAKVGTPAGLTYFMPLKDITVEIEVDHIDEDVKKPLQVKDIIIGTTPAYADRSTAYVLNHGSNWLADNKLTIEVNAAGLLQSATAASTSKVEAAFVNLANSSATFGGLALNSGDHSLTCTRPGKYTFVMDIDHSGVKKMCGVGLQVEPVNSSDIDKNLRKGYVGGAGEALSGLYYRQEIPYLVSAVHTSTSNNTHFKKEVRVSSPSQSVTQFLPVSKSFFADSTATFTLVDGVPTNYDQDNKSELVGALIIPSKVITAYFTAAGAIFTAFSGHQANEISMIQSENNLELAKRNAKRDLEAAILASDRKAGLDASKATIEFEIAKKKIDLCIAAVEFDNDNLIKDLKCGEI